MKNPESLGMRRDELPREVLRYVDNLKQQIKDILGKHNLTIADITNTPPLEETSSASTALSDFLKDPKWNSLKKSPPDYKKLTELVNLLLKTVQTGEIPPEAGIIHIEKAKNPYREALLLGCVPEDNEIVREKIEIIFNPLELKRKQAEQYRELGLPEWAEALEEAPSPILSPEWRRAVERELKEGAMAIWIPGRKFFENLAEAELFNALKNILRPIFIKGGEMRRLETLDRFVIGEHIETLRTDCYRDLPEEPFLALIQPTQAPIWQYKTNDYQELALKNLNSARKAEGLPELKPISPLEYLILQTFYTHELKRIADEKKINLLELNPLDIHSSTVFIGIHPKRNRTFAAWFQDTIPILAVSMVQKTAGSQGVRTVMRV